MNNFLCLDLETGGLNCEKSAILQAAFMGYDKNLKEIFSREMYVKAEGYQVSEKALSVNHIDLNVSEENGFSRVELARRVTIIATHLTQKNGAKVIKPIIVGHNVQFDIQFLRFLFKSIASEDKESNSIPETFDELFVEGYRVCIEYRFKEKFPNEPYSNLAFVCSKLNIVNTNAHSALADVKATYEVHKSLVLSEAEPEIPESERHIVFKFD